MEGKIEENNVSFGILGPGEGRLEALLPARKTVGWGTKGQRDPLNDISQKPWERDHRSRTWSLEGGVFYLFSW